MWVYTQVIEQEGLHTGTVKILNSHVKATCLKFIKITFFYFYTYSHLLIGFFQEKLLLKSTDICQIILHSKNYDQQKINEISWLLTEYKESKRKLLSLASAYSFIKNNLYMTLDLEFFLRLRFGILFPSSNLINVTTVARNHKEFNILNSIFQTINIDVDLQLLLELFLVGFCLFFSKTGKS